MESKKRGSIYLAWSFFFEWSSNCDSTYKEGNVILAFVTWPQSKQYFHMCNSVNDVDRFSTLELTYDRLDVVVGQNTNVNNFKN